MLRFMTDPTLLVLTQSKFAWLASGVPVERAEQRPIDLSDLAASLAVLRAHAAIASRRVRVVLDDALVHHFLVQPAMGLWGLEELRALAHARFEDLFGLDAESWTIEANWSASRAFLACAAPRALVHAVNAVAGSVISLAPGFSHCLSQRGRRASCWIVHATEAHTTAARYAGDTLQFVRSAARPADLGAWLNEQSLLIDQPLDIIVYFGQEHDAGHLGAESVDVGTPSRALALLANLSRPFYPA